MFMRNMKYVKGHGNEDKWENIPKELYDATVEYFEKYAKKVFPLTVETYMEFIKENVVREV